MEMTISSTSTYHHHKTPSSSSSSSSSFRRNSSPSSLSLRSSFLTPTTNLSTQLNSSNTRLILGKKKNKSFSCNCLFGLGVPELVVIAGVVALVFGPKKLPEVGRSIGKTVKSFQQAAKEFETELKKEPDSASAAETIEKTTVVSEEEKDEVKVPSTRES